MYQIEEDDGAQHPLEKVSIFASGALLPDGTDVSLESSVESFVAQESLEDNHRVN